MEKDKITISLEICECGEPHGRLVFSDGRTGSEFMSREDGALTVHYCWMAKVFDSVSQESLLNVQKAIEQSCLPDETNKRAFGMKHFISVWNTAKLHNPNLNVKERFHKLASFVWHYRLGDD